MAAYLRITAQPNGKPSYEHISAAKKPKRKAPWRGEKSGPDGVEEVAAHALKTIKAGPATAVIVAKASDGTWKAWPV